MAKLYFRYGTMNSGKSIEVLRTVHNYEEQGKRVLLFTPSVDDRHGIGTVASRVGMRKEARAVRPQDNLFAIARDENPDCVLIDEAQFLTEGQISELTDIVDVLDVPVIAYGLRADFQGRLFPGSYQLLALADKIEEIKTVCWHCRRKAVMNMRLKDGVPVFEGAQIQIGGNETYLPVCRRCYKQAQQALSTQA